MRQLVGENTEVVYDKGCNILGAEIKPVERWWMHAVPNEAAGIRDIDYGFTGEYFNGPDFSGEPVLTRLDPQINFNWIYHKPHDVIDSKQFCVRWTGTLHPYYVRIQTVILSHFFPAE